jgi:hypothetical protein
MAVATGVNPYFRARAAAGRRAIWGLGAVPAVIVLSCAAEAGTPPKGACKKDADCAIVSGATCAFAKMSDKYGKCQITSPSASESELDAMAGAAPLRLPRRTLVVGSHEVGTPS